MVLYCITTLSAFVLPYTDSFWWLLAGVRLKALFARYQKAIDRMLLLQLMEEVFKPRELNLIRYHLGIGQPDGERMNFQELAIRLNYNGLSGAEKAYKCALRKLRENLHSSAYGQWLSIQKTIREAKAETEAGTGCYIPSQITWIDEREVSEQFICDVASLIRIHKTFCDILEYEKELAVR